MDDDEVRYDEYVRTRQIASILFCDRPSAKGVFVKFKAEGLRPSVTYFVGVNMNGRRCVIKT